MLGLMTKIKSPNKTILVLGNGPSLKGVPFHTFNLPTIGMNLAYRYWEKLAWYPTYYACLDTNVTLEHHEEIYNMIRNHKKLGIQGFFLKRQICDYHPELIHHDAILFSDEITADTPGFSSYMRKTTGSWAVRWAIFMGYTNILLWGIDCDYEPLHKRPNIIDHNNKIIRDIPNDPNYFFDGYQRKGDTMHVPAHDKESRKVHIDSFLRIMSELRHKINNRGGNGDKEQKKEKVRIWTCTKLTRLYSQEIVKYRDISEFLKS